jgi:hypothetical protein
MGGGTVGVVGMVGVTIFTGGCFIGGGGCTSGFTNVIVVGCGGGGLGLKRSPFMIAQIATPLISAAKAIPV